MNDLRHFAVIKEGWPFMELFDIVKKIGVYLYGLTIN